MADEICYSIKLEDYTTGEFTTLHYHIFRVPCRDGRQSNEKNCKFLVVQAIFLLHYYGDKRVIKQDRFSNWNITDQLLRIDEERKHQSKTQSKVINRSLFKRENHAVVRYEKLKNQLRVKTK